MAETLLAHGPAPLAGGERYQVMVHLDAATLDAAVAGGPALARETARRLGCDASLVGLVEDGDGNVLDIDARTGACLWDGEQC